MGSAHEGNKALYRKLHPPAEVAPVALRVSGVAAIEQRPITITSTEARMLGFAHALAEFR